MPTQEALALPLAGFGGTVDDELTPRLRRVWQVFTREPAPGLPGLGLSRGDAAEVCRVHAWHSALNEAGRSLREFLVPAVVALCVRHAA